MLKNSLILVRAFQASNTWIRALLEDFSSCLLNKKSKRDGKCNRMILKSSRMSKKRIIVSSYFLQNLNLQKIGHYPQQTPNKLKKIWNPTLLKKWCTLSQKAVSFSQVSTNSWFHSLATAKTEFKPPSQIVEKGVVIRGPRSNPQTVRDLCENFWASINNKKSQSKIEKILKEVTIWKCLISIGFMRRSKDSFLEKVRFLEKTSVSIWYIILAVKNQKKLIIPLLVSHAMERCFLLILKTSTNYLKTKKEWWNS